MATIEELKRQAESGDTEAMRKVARAYLNGDFVEDIGINSIDIGFEWVYKAAELGDIEAMAEWAEICRTIKRFEESFDWEKKAAEQGYPLSQYNLGHHYDKGMGTSQNKEQAYHWFKKAAENGFTDAKYSLAVAYLTGQGTSQDISQGIYWLEQASNDGHAASKTRLGAAYIEGMGVSADEEKGISLLHEAADLGDEKAKELLKEVSEDSSSDRKDSYLENSSSSGINYNIIITIFYVIVYFLRTWVIALCIAIKDFFVVWGKIIKGDIDFFFREKPFGSAMACTIIDLNKSEGGWVGRLAFGFVLCYFIAVLRILFSPISAIKLMIEEAEEDAEAKFKKSEIFIGVAAGFIVLFIFISVISSINFGGKRTPTVANTNTRISNQVQVTSPAPQSARQTSSTNSTAAIQETRTSSIPTEQPSPTNSTVLEQDASPTVQLSPQSENISNSGNSRAVARSISSVRETRQVPQNATTTQAPAFSTRLLRASDIRGLSKQELRFLRYEIYAWKGYRFNSRDLREYFETKEWYRAQFDDVDHLLNEFERENIKFIESHE